MSELIFKRSELMFKIGGIIFKTMEIILKINEHIFEMNRFVIFVFYDNTCHPILYSYKTSMYLQY